MSELLWIKLDKPFVWVKGEKKLAVIYADKLPNGTDAQLQIFWESSSIPKRRELTRRTRDAACMLGISNIAQAKITSIDGLFPLQKTVTIELEHDHVQETLAITFLDVANRNIQLRLEASNITYCALVYV